MKKTGTFGLVLVFAGLFCPLMDAHAQERKRDWTSGWESDRALVRVKEGHKWLLGNPYSAYPFMAYNLRSDAKWILISNTEANSRFFGYYWDGRSKEWVPDDSLVKGLKRNGVHEYPALAYNVMNDNKWILITHTTGFHGYYWDGSRWIEDSSRVKGLPDVGIRTSHAFLQNFKGDGKWTLITGTSDGKFRSFYWNGAKWIEDSSRVSGLPDIGSRARVSAGFNVFGNDKWNLIVTTYSSRSFMVFRWDGEKWNEDSTKALGLREFGLPRLLPALGCNLRGDGKWVLISGVGKSNTLLGFFYNTTDISRMPKQKDIVSHHPLATTVRIKFSYPNTWDHRIKYSTKPDMSKFSWSKWFKDMDKVDVKIEGLIPDKKYYYEVYTYIPWKTSCYVKSPIYGFTTIPAQKHVIVKPGKSIQDALEFLPLEGGTIELAEGIHDVTETIIINRSNITIQGTHTSVIRVNDRDKPAFVVPHENPSSKESWATMPVIKNLTFKGFKVASSYKRRGNSLILAYNVKNLIVEDILDESHLGHFILIVGHYSQGVTNHDIFVKNNNILQAEICTLWSKNVHIVGNKIKKAAHSAGIDVNWGNEYVYIRNNTIYGGANYNIRGHGGNHVWIENNILLGGTQRCIWIDGLSNVTIRNNIMTGSKWAAIHIQPQAPRYNVKILNNIIYNNRDRGIWTSEYSHGFRKKNSDIEVRGNVISYNGGDAIQMGTKWAQFKSISNNIISNNKGYGVNYIETVKPTTIKCNNVWNNTKGNYNNTSSGNGDISTDPLFIHPEKGEFHLKSKVGRWDPKAKKWVKDVVYSPCIDAGNPKADFSQEPSPNGGRVNMGAYGNTTEASKSIKK